MKWKCQECGEVCLGGQILRAENPFLPGDKIHGCPACLKVECLLVACDEDGCNEVASIGAPTREGYRVTCHKHGIGLAKTKDSNA